MTTIRAIIMILKNHREQRLPILSAFLFAFLMFAVFVVNILIPDKTFSAEENRMLQDFPKFSISEYLEGRYESKLENYASDQFMLRKQFVKVKAATDVTEGKLEANGVYRAKDDYLIENITTPKVKNLRETEQALARFRAAYPDKKMYFLLAPNAGNILKDKLPATVRLADQDKFMDPFFANITTSGYQVIDIRKAFRDHSKGMQLYYRTDHHWTSEGAYLAYQQAVQPLGLGAPIAYKPLIVKNDFAGTMASKSGFTGGSYDTIKIYAPLDPATYKPSVINYADTKEKTTEFFQLDNLNKKDAYTVFGGSNHPIYTIKTPTESGSKLLLFKDSYANSMIPFLAQHYREIVVVDPRYYFGDIKDVIDAEGITDVLFLYNANTFFGDDSLAMMLNDM